MSTEDNWDTIEVSDKEEIEFEVEDETVQNVAEQQEKEPVQLELPEVEQVGATEEEQEDRPQELEGIETKGAEKRIRQLIRQRKERDEQITELANFNRKLQEELTTKKTEVNRISKNSLDMTEKQLNDKVSLARRVYMEAFEEGDKERVLQAQEILNDAQADLKNVSMRKQPAQVVSGASRSSPSSNKKVKLSKEDVRLANKWGIPLEQYAAEKLKVTQADGEYTVVT